MFRNCLAQLVGIFIVGALALWFFRAPESVAGLITGFAGLIVGGADALGRFASALVPTLSGLI